MAKEVQKHGILALIELIDFILPSLEHDQTSMLLSSEHYREQIRKTAEAYGFECIKDWGQAVVFFGEDLKGFINVVFDLFCRRPIPGKRGFNLNLRIVAHTGYVYFTGNGQGRKTDFAGSDSVKSYLLEKRARIPEITVTDALFHGLRPYLDEMGFVYYRETHGSPLSVFEFMGSATVTYRIFPPIVECTIPVSSRYRQKREALLELSQTVPVFGDLFPPLEMEESFINVSLEKEWQHAYERGAFRTSPFSTKRLERFDGRSFHEERQKFDEIKADELLRHFNKGYILGLPGSGKTTMLRHMFYTTLRENPEAIVLLVNCRDMAAEDTSKPADTLQEILYILAAGFLFPGTSADHLSGADIEELEYTAQSFLSAWQQKRLTVFIDALDESPTRGVRDNVLFFARTLMNNIALDGRPEYNHGENKCFLTSRLAEFPVRALFYEPIFHVNPITPDDMRKMAARFYGAESEVFKRFDDRIWREPVIKNVGGTPLTAMLLLVYFEMYGTFDLRYYAYDLILKFILKRIWERIKQGRFKTTYQDIAYFFAEVPSPHFFDDNPEVRNQYDALSALAYDALYRSVSGEVVRIIPKKTLVEHCKNWLLSNDVTAIERSNPWVRERIARQVTEWIENFTAEHLLIRDTFESYVFVHATVMEFLAARHFVCLLEKGKADCAALVNSPEKEELETLPLAAGVHYETGFAVLNQLRPLYEGKAETSTVPFRCLSETEAAERKALENLSTSRVYQPEKDRIERGIEAKAWVYRSLARIVVEKSRTELENLTPQFATLIPLCRPIFGERYLAPDWYSHADWAVRETFLRTILEKEIAQEIIKRPADQAAAAEESLLILDKPDSPFDKNFAYYQQQVSSSLRGFFGSPNFRHSAPVIACGFSPDGRLIVSGSSDHTLKIWETESGRELRTLEGHHDGVTTCGFSPDGRLIVSGSLDHTIKLWEAATGQEFTTLTGHTDWVRACGFSPDGTCLVSGSDDHTLRIWEVSGNRESRVLEGHRDWVRACVFSPDGKHIVSGSSDHTVKIWEVSTGRVVTTLEGHRSMVDTCAFSPDGKHIVSGSSDRTLKIWEAATGHEVMTLEGHKSVVSSCAFSPDGKHIVSGSSDRTLKIWEAATGHEVMTLEGHKSMVRACGFSPSGKLIASGSSDHTIKVWEAATGREAKVLEGHKDWVSGCGFSPDGKYIVSGASDHLVKVWEVASGHEVKTLEGHKCMVSACGFSPDGKYIVSGSSDRTVRVWEAASGRELRTLKGHKDWVKTCGFSPDGKYIVSGSSDRTVRVWEAASGRELRTLEGHYDWVIACAFSPDGKVIVSSSSDQTLKLWDTETGRELRTLEGHKDWVRACGFSPGGRCIISGSSDRTVRLWETESGQELKILRGHADGVSACGFSPDGRLIVSGSRDHTLKIWKADGSRELKSFKLLWAPLWIAFCPTNPNLLVTANANTTLTIFDFSGIG